MVFDVLKKIKQHLFLFIVLEIIFGLVLGILLKDYIPHDLLKLLILPIIYVMLLPPMINLNIRELFKFDHVSLVVFVLLVNFILFPLISYGFYLITGNFDLFLALLLLSLLPTGSMTLNFVNMLHGNIHVATLIQVLSLTIGAVLVSLVVPFVVGSFGSSISISTYDLLYKVSIVIFVPMVLGQIIKYSFPSFVQSNKEKLRLIGMSGMLMIILVSMLLKAAYIASNIYNILVNILLILIYYLVCIFVAYASKIFIKDSKDWIAVFYSLFLKNISISLGLCVILFPESVIYLVVAYLIQLPLASFAMHKLEKEVVK